MGLMKWPFLFHPVAMMTAAERVSCIGAVIGIFCTRAGREVLPKYKIQGAAIPFQ